jgi:hypothetical protein
VGAKERRLAEVEATPRAGNSAQHAPEPSPLAVAIVHDTDVGAAAHSAGKACVEAAMPPHEG